MAKEVRAINSTAGTERNCEKSDISELGTRRVNEKCLLKEMCLMRPA